MKSVVMRTCYGILSMSRLLDSVMYVILEKKFLLIFITLSHVHLVDVYACFNSFFFFFFLFSFIVSLCCFALYYTVLYCMSGE